MLTVLFIELSLSSLLFYKLIGSISLLKFFNLCFLKRLQFEDKRKELLKEARGMTRIILKRKEGNLNIVWNPLNNNWILFSVDSKNGIESQSIW